MSPYKLSLMVIGAFATVAGVSFLSIGKPVEAPTLAFPDATDAQRAELASALPDAPAAVPVSGIGTLGEIRAMPYLRCDVSSIDHTNGAYRGVTYHGKDAVRGDFNVQHAGRLFESHFILTDDMLYSWTETAAGSEGVRVPAAEYVSRERPEPGMLALNEPIAYDCAVWEVNDDHFSIPKDLRFIEPA